MNQPSVSIIVPVYNVEPYVEDCIRSVMRQTYTGPMECIIVDDCGTDNSMAFVKKVIAEYSGPISFKILYHEHNRGLSAARNTGIDTATGDYLYFLDSDDWLSDDCIAKLASVVIENVTEIVQGNVKTYPEIKPDFREKHFSFSQITTNRDVRYCCYHGNQMNYAWNKLLNTLFIKRYNLKFKEDLLWEDALWNFNIQKFASNVSFVSAITYYYRIRPNSIVRGTDIMIRHSSYSIVYNEILLNLTPEHEQEELKYYIKNFPYRYANYPLIYQDTFNLFWKKMWQYKSFYCCQMLILAYLLRIKWTRFIISVLRKKIKPFFERQKTSYIK